MNARLKLVRYQIGAQTKLSGGQIGANFTHTQSGRGRVAYAPNYPGSMFVSYPDLAVKLNVLLTRRRMEKLLEGAHTLPLELLEKKRHFTGVAVAEKNLTVLEQKITDC